MPARPYRPWSNRCPRKKNNGRFAHGSILSLFPEPGNAAALSSTRRRLVQVVGDIQFIQREAARLLVQQDDTDALSK